MADLRAPQIRRFRLVRSMLAAIPRHRRRHRRRHGCCAGVDVPVLKSTRAGEGLPNSVRYVPKRTSVRTSMHRSLHWSTALRFGRLTVLVADLRIPRFAADFAARHLAAGHQVSTLIFDDMSAYDELVGHIRAERTSPVRYGHPIPHAIWPPDPRAMWPPDPPCNMAT